jgi:zinc D-Ala-D-Ala dipeptidase
MQTAYAIALPTRGRTRSTGFDLFSPLSWPTEPGISAQARANRMLLQTLMVEGGFAAYEQEWWHFTLADEPFPERYFDFPVR